MINLTKLQKETEGKRIEEETLNNEVKVLNNKISKKTETLKDLEQRCGSVLNSKRALQQEQLKTAQIQRSFDEFKTDMGNRFKVVQNLCIKNNEEVNKFVLFHDNRSGDKPEDLEERGVEELLDTTTNANEETTIS